MDISRLLTDEVAMTGLLQRGLPGFRDGLARIEGCSVTQSRRRISRRTREQGAPYLGVCYALAVRDTLTGRLGSQSLYAKAYSRGASLDAYRAAWPQHCIVPRFGEPVMHLPEFDMVVWSLPNDPAMAQLPAFLDPVGVRAHLPLARIFAAEAAASGASEAAQVEAVHIVRHEPEEHCTARFSLRYGDERAAIYGKSYRGEEWRDARDCLAALWRQGGADPQAFIVGRPLGACPILHAVWQREVTGVALAGELAGPAADALLHTLAVALSRLHAGGPLQGRAEPLGETLDTARKWRKKLLQAEPRFAAPLDHILARLEAQEDAPPPRMRPIHGDFHVDQMLWCDGRIALFDYDNFALGAPARDVADFVSQLLCREGEVGEGAGIADWPAIAVRFITHYRAANGGAPDDRELDWYLRLMLLRKAYSFFVRHRAGWPGRVRRALADAEAGLAALPLTRPEVYS
ncbi:hypothetical protein [Aromatoleum diolicum]|uniref:Aminoglycoside phosphotransferase domain-containing protein n=1 Tax=Aromatoleum diolicum TaxID=75796 RepID=A0ABX1QB66_9RHOO|nr:hypothetical protein [Aromatoleum diolicum]NMG75573.1 hypothetical protein [Aromatoleum diolicum]